MSKLDFVKDFLREAEKANLKRSLRNVVPISARQCLADGKKCLNFSSNNYLALSEHPRVKEEAIKWTEKYGAGSGASRLVTGGIDAYLELEERIAEWKKKEAAMIFGAGYMANTGLIPALAGRKSLIFADKLNHASLNAGCALSGAKFIRFRHNDMAHLDELLENSDPSASKIIVDETVFSMDGDLSDVGSLKEIAEKHNALLFLDDAHGSGVFGEKGEGLAGGGDCDISMGTFSKALGSYGAYAACSKELKEYFVNKCASFIYTTALPPGVCGAISAAVELVQTDEFACMRESLHKKASVLRSALKDMGFDTGNSASQIIPVIIGETEKVLEVSKSLYESGILVIAIRPPTVPQGTARIRIAVNSAHTDDDISLLIDKLKELAI
jgi:8-amino-7-oxononanoate synthase